MSHKFSLSCWVFAVIAVASSVSPVRAYGQVLHAVVIEDTTEEAGLGSDIVADSQRIRGWLGSQIPSSQLRVSRLVGNQITRDAVLNAVGGLKIVPARDSVFVYYTGHGAYDLKRGFYMHIARTGESVAHHEIATVLGKLKPHTGVLVTDSCGNVAEMKPSSKLGYAAQLKDASELTPLAEFLFFGPRKGLVSITSSDKGQSSFISMEGTGSLFTSAFVKSAEAVGDRRVFWDQLCADTQPKLSEGFKVLLQKHPQIGSQDASGKVGIDLDRDGKPDQFDQTLRRIWIAPEFGVVAEPGSPGLTITYVVPLSPAAIAGFEVGDTILSVNGVDVNTKREFEVAIEKSGPTAMLKVKAQQGSIVNPTVKLNRL